MGGSIRCRSRLGFTIIELMVVVAILGTLAYTIITSYEAILPAERLNTSVRELAGVLQGTRSDAISRNAEFFIEYDLDEERYRVLTPYRVGGGRMVTVEEEREDERLTLVWIPLNKGIAFHSVILAGEQYAQGIVVVRFDPLGAASDHSIILTQPAYENFFTIEVLALTGLMRFHDGVFTREPPQDEDFN